jgi:hypothetical protein
MARRIQVRFDTGRQVRLVFAKIQSLHKKTGMSVSRIAYLAMLYGLPRAAETITGVYLDAQVTAESDWEEIGGYII